MPPPEATNEDELEKRARDERRRREDEERRRQEEEGAFRAKPSRYADDGRRQATAFEKLSTRIDDKPSREDMTSRGTPVSEFNRERHPVSHKPSMDVEGAPQGGKYTRMGDPSSMHTRYTDPDKYVPPADTRKNPSGPKMRMSWEREEAQLEARAAAAGMDAEQFSGLVNALRPEFVGQLDFKARFEECWPTELKPLVFGWAGSNVYAETLENCVATLYDEGGTLSAQWMTGGGSDFMERTETVWVGANDMTPTWTDEQKAADDLWLRVYFDGITACVVSDSEITSDDESEVYRIRVNGATIRWDDIHETRA